MTKHRLVVARPVPPAVTDRARDEFDAVLSDGADMPPNAVVQALTDHKAEALFFSSNLKLSNTSNNNMCSNPLLHMRRRTRTIPLSHRLCSRISSRPVLLSTRTSPPSRRLRLNHSKCSTTHRFDVYFFN